MAEKLQIRVKKGNQLSGTEIEEMYKVRSHFMDLKPEIPKEKDFKFFKDTVTTANKVFLFTTKSGSIKGLYSVHQFVEKNKDGKRRLVVEPEFGFILEEYQGKYMAKTVRRNALIAMIKYPFMEKYLLGPAYPASYLTLQKYGGNVWTWLDKNIPDDVKDVLITYARRHEMIENGNFTGIKSLYTLPKKTGPEEIGRLEKKPSYAHYKTLNPNWQDGYGLVTLIKISLPALLKQFKQQKKRR
jgi:hypothetical protein